MSDLHDLYQEVILDHNRNPRNYRIIDPSSHHADGFNPLCGDKVSVYLDVKDGVIHDVSFQGDGCAISTASASLMTEALKGKTVQQARRLFEGFHDLVTTDVAPDDVAFGKLEVLAGVKEYPTRVKCATLAWHTLQAALADKQQPVSTE